MQDLAQNVRIQQAISPQSVTSVKAGDYVNMENYANATVIIETGTVTVGSKVAIRGATDASGTGVAAIAAPFKNNKFYKSYTATSVTSSTSVHYITIANADDSKTFIASIDASKMAATKPYLNVYVNDSTCNALLSATYVLWGARYQGDPPADPTG